MSRLKKMPPIEFKYNGKCKECKSHKLILEYPSNYIICCKCGLVQNYKHSAIYNDLPKR